MAERKTAKRKASSTEQGPKAKQTKNESPKSNEISEDVENVLNFYAEKRKAALPGNEKEFKFNKKRVRMMSKAEEMPTDCNGILYWMFRDQRVEGFLLI